MKEEKFYLISFIATYVYLKEKYDDISDGLREKNPEDIANILSLLQPLEKFIAIPDKKEFIENSIEELREIFIGKSISKEKEFLSRVNKYTINLEEDEKLEIINIIIYVTDNDQKISNIEKESIIQISHAMGLEGDYSKLLSNYKKSPLANKVNYFGIIIFGIILTIFLSAFAYYMYTKQKNPETVKIFNEKRVVFNQVYFNRFVIYKNKANVKNKHFKKEAIYYISGEAEVSFEPSDITYDPSTKTITYILPKDSPFHIEMNKVKTILVDEIKPIPISEKEAAIMASGIGVAGGILGAGIGEGLGSLYPNPLSKIGGKIIGGLVGGVGSGIVAFNIFKGMELSKNITRKEKAEIKDKSVQLIETILKYNYELTKGYKASFIKYIKRRYARYGKIVEKVKFDNKRIEK